MSAALDILATIVCFIGGGAILNNIALREETKRLRAEKNYLKDQLRKLETPIKQYGDKT